MTETKIRAPKWFGILAALAFLWNLMGMIAFFFQTFISEEAFEKLPIPEQELYASYPLWTHIAYGIAVFGGLAGSAGLGMKRKWAIPAFIISLCAILPQQIYSLFYTKTQEVYGSGSIFMPIAVIAIGIFLTILSIAANKKGWLK